MADRIKRRCGLVLTLVVFFGSVGWAFGPEEPPTMTRTLKDRGIIVPVAGVHMYGGTEPAGSGRVTRAPKAKAVTAWRRFSDQNGRGWSVRWNHATQTAHWVTSQSTPIAMNKKLTRQNIESACSDFISENADLLGAQPMQLLPAGKSKAGGRWSVAFKQMHEGIPVVGGQVRMLFTPDDRLIAFGSDVYPDVDVQTQPKISDKEALEAAQANCIDDSSDDRTTKPELVIIPVYRPQKFEYLLCWQVEIFQPLIEKNWRYLIEANTGAVVSKSNTLIYDDISGTIRGEHKPEFASDDSAVEPFPYQSIIARAPDIVLGSWTFDSNPGWSTEGDWAFGTPTAPDYYCEEPNSGYTGTKVYGYKLDGNYPDNLEAKYLTTPAIDCSGYDNIQLSFMRWLGVEGSRWDNASIEVSTDANNWTTVWTNPESALCDNQWVQAYHDISAVAAMQPTVYIRWVMGPTDVFLALGGWNIDDVQVIALRDEMSSTHTNADGSYTLAAPSNPATISSQIKGLYCNINYSCGPDSQFTLPGVEPSEGADFTWDESTSYHPAEPSVYWHTNYVHDYFSVLDPNLSDASTGYPHGLDYQMPVRVQHNCFSGFCNAYWDGKGMTYGAGDGIRCDDFGLYSEVVYHEYTHATTSKIYAGIFFPYLGESGALNEAWSDYFGRLLSPSQNPMIGDGGLLPSRPEGFRTMDNDYRRETDFVNEVHDDSEMFSSALWGVRDVIKNKLDPEEWDEIVHFSRYMHPQTFEECLLALLLEDDIRYGDGYLGNGTAHSEPIYTSFGNHGIGGLQYLAPSIMIDDSTGNGDGKLDPGETANLSLYLTNGWSDATDISVRLVINDPFVKIAKPQTAMPDVEHGGITSNIHDPFVVSLVPNCPKTHTLNFELKISARGPYIYSRTCLLTYPVAVDQFVYDDGQFDELYLGHGSRDGAMAVRITPQQYPSYPAKIRLYPPPGTNNKITIRIWDDDGPDGLPGTVLGSIDADIITDSPGWYDVSVASMGLKIDDGSFYAGWVEKNRIYYNGLDMDPPYHRRSWVRFVWSGGGQWIPLEAMSFDGNLMIRMRYLNDLGEGPVENKSIGKRYATIQAAVDDAYPDEEIVLDPGTYYENVHLANQNLILRSVNPDDPSVVAATIINANNNGPAVTCSEGIDESCMLRGLTIKAGHDAPENKGGISCTRLGETGPTISKCVITANSGPGIYCKNSSPAITHCVIFGNQGAGIELVSASNPTIDNCTITNNLQHGIISGYPSVKNSIIWGNKNPQIKGAASVLYSDIAGGWPGLGNIDADPCFVDPNIGDYHLKSAGWRWDRDIEQWTWDDVTSRCIDAGNPGTVLGGEAVALDVDPLNRVGRNLRIDMGAYGGTTHASIAPHDSVFLGDLTNDGTTDFVDLMHWAQYWLTPGENMPGDTNKNSFVDFIDFAWLAESWAMQTSWHR